MNKPENIKDQDIHIAGGQDTSIQETIQHYIAAMPAAVFILYGI